MPSEDTGFRHLPDDESREPLIQLSTHAGKGFPSHSIDAERAARALTVCPLKKLCTDPKNTRQHGGAHEYATAAVVQRLAGDAASHRALTIPCCDHYAEREIRESRELIPIANPT